MVAENFQNSFDFHQVVDSFTLSKKASKSGFYKTKGVPVKSILDAKMDSILLKMSLNEYVKSRRANLAEDYSKTTVYDFYSCQTHNWRNFHGEVASSVIKELKKISPTSEKKVFLVDDTIISRAKSFNVEELTWVFDHVEHKKKKGYQAVTVAWNDGVSTIPCDFALKSSKKPVIEKNTKSSKKKDQRTHACKRAKECKKPKNDLAIEMIARALKSGIKASHGVCDSWYTTIPFALKLRELDVHLIGRLKNSPFVKFLHQGEYLTLNAIYNKLEAENKLNFDNDILGSVEVDTKITNKAKKSIKVKLVFAKNTCDSTKMFCILSTDLDMPDEEIIQIYSRRFGIEVMYKFLKNTLGFVSGCIATLFQTIIAHATMVCLVATFIEFIKRLCTDERTAGAVFNATNEEIKVKPYKDALKTLLETNFKLIDECIEMKFIKKSCIKKVQEYAINKISNWLSSQFKSVEQLAMNIINKLRANLNLPQVL